MIADFEKRAKEANYSMHPVYTTIFDTITEMKDFESAAKYYTLIKTTPRDEDLSDCEACVINANVYYFYDSAQYAKALEEAEPLMNGTLSCYSVPKNTYRIVMLAAFFTGDFEAAVNFYKKGKHSLKGNSLIDTAPENIVFLTLTRNFTTALNLVKKTIQKQLSGNSLSFYLACRFLFTALQQDGRKTVKVVLPVEFELYSKDNSYDPAVLAEWFYNKTADYVERLDKRNGNNGNIELRSRYDDYLNQMLDEKLSLK